MSTSRKRMNVEITDGVRILMRNGVSESIFRWNVTFEI